VAEGKSLGKTAGQLTTEFQNMTDWQLQRIARTETHSVYNEAKYETMLNADAIIGKKWLTSGIVGNMRDWHEEMEGETAYVDEPFSNGLMYPGDPDGPPEEVINCACTMTPVIRAEELE
jgi:hypothetical protein